MKRFGLFLALIMTFMAVMPSYSYAKVPGIKAKRTAKNVLKLTKKYDKDAYYILKNRYDEGDRIAYWVKPGKRIIDRIDTCVHEEFHMYVFGAAKTVDNEWSLAFFRGNKKTRFVPVRSYVKTEKATKSLPKKYRTFRYKLYVGKGSDSSSNVMGHIGLLNEFTAYYWGSRVMYKLYPYMKKRVKKASGWSPFVASFLDGREAYAEFYFWTLTYLDHLRKNNKEVYKSIMENKEYLRALKDTETRFRKLNKAYLKRMNKVSKKYNGRSFKKSVRKGRFRIGKYYYKVRKGYKVLKKQIASKKFKAVKRDINKNSK